MISEHNGWPRTIASIFRAIATTGFKERSSYLNSMRNGLEIWENEHVARATATSDFVVADLRGVNGKPFSLYICVPEKDIEVFAGITRMLLTNICNFANSQPKDVAAKGKGITFFIDEAPRLGYMPKVVLDGPALGRKVRMNFCCIAQDPGQVRAVYGNDGWETIKTVYQFKIVYHQVNTSVQKELADMIGFETRTRQSRTIRKGLRKGPVKGSESEEGAYLVRPEEFGNLAQYHSLVFVPHHYSNPIRSEGAYAPERREFKRKYGLQPPAARPVY